ncbi:MAG: hypothetical protein ABL861_09940 [Nitrosomonas sp.]
MHYYVKYLAMIGILLLTACAGHDRILFLTKTNVGLDVSQAPLPTAELTIARREVAISPTYQDTISERTCRNSKGEEFTEDTDKTLPLLAAFALTGNFFNPDISSVFAGGSPAVTLAKEDGEDKDKNIYHSIWLDRAPDTRSPFKRMWQSLYIYSRSQTDSVIKQEITDRQNQVKPFYFATDTSFGVKVAWDGTGGPYPTNLKIGYNRTEFAYPPILISEISETELQKSRTCGADAKRCEARWEVKVPSFFASLENRANLSKPLTDLSKPLTDSNTGVSQIQVFATGEAAKEWAKRRSIQKATFKLMAPTAAEIEEKASDNKQSNEVSVAR